MKPGHRRTPAILVIATLLGIGIGLQIAQSGLTVATGTGMWIAILGSFGLAAILVLPRPTSQDAPPAVSDQAAWMEFRRELRRARRHGRPLTLVRIPGATSATSATDPADGADPLDLAAIARRIGVRLRLIDRSWVDEGDIYVMLPESPRSAASTVVQRLEAVAPERLWTEIRVASFPEDGLTSGAIIGAVHDAGVGPVPIPIRPALDEGAAFARDEVLAVGETTRR
ncbi:MAG: hypothetical protein WEG56_01335 [Chloroflexota bacterium]